MPKPFKPTRPFRLPAADHVDVAGKPHVRLRKRGTPALYPPLTKDGTNTSAPRSAGTSIFVT